MHAFFRFAGCLALVSLTVGCAAFSSESVRSSSSSEGKPFVGSDFLPQGVAVGDISAQKALLWLRTDGPASVQIEWATVSRWERASKLATVMAPVSRTASITTTAETDYTLIIPLEDLIPATRYRYHVLVGSADQTIRRLSASLAAMGEFTTLQDDKTSATVTFAWSGDLGGQGRCRQGMGGYPIFDVIHRHSPDFFLFLGDTIYSDNPCPSPPNEPGADFKATTLQTYRVRHRYQRGAEALRRFLRTVPVYVIWDDHEVRNDFAGA